MKAAILGTAQVGKLGEETTILHNAGLTTLQQMAGYVAQTMPVKPLILPPVTAHDQQTADAIMSGLCRRAVHNCNLRVPYLMLAWLLVGSDNEFRVAGYAAKDSYLRLVTLRLLRFAVGEHFTAAQLQPIVDRAWLIKENREEDIWLNWADETIAWIIWAIHSTGEEAVKAVEAAIWSATHFAMIHAPVLIEKQAKDWCYIEDDDAWLIIQWLLLDVLNAGGEL
jgi:hypothetical protein